MKSLSFSRITVSTLFSVILILFMAACAASATQPPAVEQTVSNAPVVESSGDAVESTATLTPTQEPTETPEPTPLPPTATPEPEPLIITAQGFGQNKRGELGYGFILENPNQAFGVNGAQYKITFYDAGGTELQTKNGYVAAFLPGQKLGVADNAFLGGDVIVDRIEIQLEQGKAVPLTDFPADMAFTPLTAEKISYYPISDQNPFEVATGVVVNPNDIELRYTRISFIAYNAAGEIVGGGWDTLSFLTPMGRAGALSDLKSSGDVVRVEMYPAVNSLYDLFAARKLPEGAQPPTLLKQGYARSNDNNVGYGLVIQNPNTNYLVVENIQITFYAEDGRVLGTSSNQITLFPNGTTGVGDFLSIREDAEIAQADILISPEIYKEYGELPLLTVSNYSVKNLGFFQKVTGEVNNSTASDKERVIVNAVAYNEAGEIIGGGQGGVALVPANGKADLEMTMFAAGTAAKVEFYVLYDVE